MSLTMTQQRGMAQARAEDAAWEKRGEIFGVSFKQGHRSGWHDYEERILAQQIHPDMAWLAAATDVFLDLLARGVLRSGRDIDNAIQSAREALHADEGAWFDPNSRHGWEVLEPHVYRFLDLTDDELAAIA